MVLTSAPVPNLIGGVSQQPEVLRFPNQAELQENCYPSPVDGLTRRHPTQAIGPLIDLSGGEWDPDFNTHIIDRDSREQYMVLLKNREVQINDLEGNAIPVYGPGGIDPDFTYLDTSIANGNPVQAAETFDPLIWINDISAIDPVLTSERAPLNDGSDVYRLGTTGIAVTQAEYLQVDVFSTADQINFSCYVKNENADHFAMTIRRPVGPVHTGAIFSFPGAGAVPTLDSIIIEGEVSIENVGDDWYRLTWALGDFGTQSLPYGVELRVQEPGDTIANKSLLVWGAQINSSPTVEDAFDSIIPQPADYLVTAQTLKALTVQDYTFITNTEKVTAMDPTLTDVPLLDKAFVFVRQAVGNGEYNVDLKLASGVLENVQSMPAAEQGQTTRVAGVLQTDLDLIANVTATQVGSVVAIVPGVTQTIEILEVSDSEGDMSLIKMHEEIDRFSNLPLNCEDGFKIKVTAEPESDSDDYYVIFVGDEGGGELGPGHWEETVAEGVEFTYDASTMPHQLVRMQDDDVGTVTGTPFQIYFEFTEVVWDDRLVGDTDSNPDPSFIGSTINDTFFFKNRLGFLSGENVILSEVNLFFNFWRTTLTTLLDSDPIDVTSSHTRVAVLNHAIPDNDNLVLWSAKDLFLLQGDPVVSPKTVSITPQLSFESLLNVQPAQTGSGIFFPVPQKDFTSVREFFERDTAVYDSTETTQAVPRYIAGEALELAGSGLANMVAVSCSGSPGSLFMYKFLLQGRETAQAAWSEYTFPGGEVRGMGWVESTLYLVITRHDGVVLEKMEVGDGITDTGAAYLTHLDRRTPTVVSAVHDVGEDETTFILPYAPDLTETTVVVTRQTDSTSGGNMLQTVDVTNSPNTIVVEGDHTEDDVWIGQLYESRYRFTKPIPKEQTARGALSPVQSGRTGARFLQLSHENTSFYQIQSTPKGRSTKTAEFSGELPDDTLLDEASFRDGVFRVAIMSRDIETQVDIVSDGPLPFRILSAEWDLDRKSRTKRGAAL